jgi:hypothetical protein
MLHLLLRFGLVALGIYGVYRLSKTIKTDKIKDCEFENPEAVVWNKDHTDSVTDPFPGRLGPYTNFKDKKDSQLDGSYYEWLKEAYKTTSE